VSEYMTSNFSLSVMSLWCQLPVDAGFKVLRLSCTSTIFSVDGYAMSLSSDWQLVAGPNQWWSWIPAVGPEEFPEHHFEVHVW